MLYDIKMIMHNIVWYKVMWYNIVLYIIIVYHIVQYVVQYLFVYLLSVKKYVISVVTGDISGAGTDANVFLTLFGDKGDTGERKLHKSETYRDKFERGQVWFSTENISTRQTK